LVDDDIRFKVIDDSNPFRPFLGKLVRAQVRGDNGSITGEVEKISDKYMVLRHRDGRTSILKLTQIVAFSELPRERDGDD
jgi:hypothetical protein